jgi:cytochrome c oxidase subunit 2
MFCADFSQAQIFSLSFAKIKQKPGITRRSSEGLAGSLRFASTAKRISPAIGWRQDESFPGLLLVFRIFLQNPASVLYYRCLAPFMIRSSKQDRGSAAPAVLLALLLTVLVLATVYVFAAHLFPPPAPITATAILVDRQYHLTLWVTGVVFVLAQLGLAYAVLRFQDRGQHARFIRGNLTMEVLWTAVTLVVFLSLAITGRKAWAQDRYAPEAPGAIQVEVTTTQFVYTFRYPGKDGKFGRLDPRLISAPTGNPLGLDPDDPAGRDDIVVPSLTVPVNHPVELLLRSQDMVHNFFVRELRLQQDAVPGMMVPLQFTANRVGQYEIVCTQLCGLGHSTMHSFLNVVSESDYGNFLKRLEAGQ